MKNLKNLLAVFALSFSVSSNALADVLSVQHDNDIPYVSGGIGKEERDELAALSKQFNVHITLALQGGDFISDAFIEIINDKGETVLSQNAEGPQFLAALQPGTYTVRATWQDIIKERGITVKENSREKPHFYWASE